jgi:hypothetical protein
MFLWGSRAPPRAPYQVWWLGAVTFEIFCLVNIFLPGGCLRGEGKGLPQASRGGLSPARSMRPSLSTSGYLGLGPPGWCQRMASLVGHPPLIAHLSGIMGYPRSHYADSNMQNNNFSDYIQERVIQQNKSHIFPRSTDIYMDFARSLHNLNSLKRWSHTDPRTWALPGRAQVSDVKRRLKFKFWIQGLPEIQNLRIFLELDKITRNIFQ